MLHPAASCAAPSPCGKEFRLAAGCPTVRREEDGQLLLGSNPGLEQLKQEVLGRGLLLGGRRFQFLGCSSRQLRSSQACWMTSLPVEPLLEDLGDLSGIFIPGKYLSRAGQLLTGIAAAVELQPQQVEEVPDISWEDSSGREQCFTDGSGCISLDCMCQVRCLRA